MAGTTRADKNSFKVASPIQYKVLRLCDRVITNLYFIDFYEFFSEYLFGFRLNKFLLKLNCIFLRF